jgi:alpha-glucuronidase
MRSMPWLPTLLILIGGAVAAAQAEDGADGWLRYAPPQGAGSAVCRAVPHTLVLLGDDALSRSAGAELTRGLGSMCGVTLQRESAVPHRGDALVVGTLGSVEAAVPGWRPKQAPGAQGFALGAFPRGGGRTVIIAGEDARGTLYGSFALLAQLGEGRGSLLPAECTQTPANAIRWVDQWDNLDGSMERGYGGRSIFFDHGQVRADLSRVSAYGRLLASVGLNGVNVNNVNASPQILTPKLIDGVGRIADALRPWGVRVSISVDFSSPEAIGGLPTFDPLNPEVAAWWKKTVDALYARIPDFAGFTVKADSEGQPGPSQYGRNQAEAANMLARALAPHGGLVFYRAFVYNHHMDWHDRKADRAKAAYDIFHPLDGKFDSNVIVQIKNGPIDFQVREPVSPLFAGLRHTNEAIELEITQEYTGQQRHLVYLVPQWKTYLDTDMRAGGRSTPVKAIVSGKSFDRPIGGFVGVANVGLDTNWMAHPLAMANLYGYGRLAWNPDLPAEQIVDAWTRLTFSDDPLVDHTIDAMQMRSWHLYEEYTGPLGLGTLVDIIGAHYGPGPESAERNGWGQWLRATHEGIGMDRTVATGTGFIGQYPPQLAAQYETAARCPDALLLFMHHVPYTHRLHSGRTVIQYVYDSHYAGAAGAAQLVDDWKTLEGHIDAERYRKVLTLQTYQAGHAIVWRDAITKWFLRESGIPDDKGRVGRYPDRIEAEDMQLRGYTVANVTPWETASGGKAVVCSHTECTATAKLTRPAGEYRIAVAYYDFHDGASTYSLALNGREIARWRADNTLPTDAMNGSTATRYTLAAPVALQPGDTLTLTGRPQVPEPAPVDYIAITPVSGKAGDK